MGGEQQIALTRETVARVTGLSAKQLDYWAETALITPAVDESLSPRNRVRLYGFSEALALSVVAELRKHRGVSLQHIRQIVGRLKTRGYQQPLTELAFATVGNKVFFQHPDGTWEGSLHPDQIVIHQVLSLAPLRERIMRSTSRDADQHGHIEKRRKVLGSKPVFAGTRIPVDTVRRYLAAGKTTAEVLAAYPDLTEDDIEAVRRETAA
ncbi:DUF433 domain-containing protein [Nocardia sp. NPDC049149]|uniref:DUF433 domain-containing protein n=1 Tax=Nocardia sp. NPDC049149 TaxID=3364315 RepID=UPI003720C916